MRTFINGQEARVLTNAGGFAATFGGRIVGVFPSELMACEAIVQAVEQAHAVRMPRSAV